MKQLPYNVLRPMKQDNASLEKTVATNLMYLIVDTLETCQCVVGEEGGLTQQAKQKFNTIKKNLSDLAQLRLDMSDGWAEIYGMMGERYTKAMLLMLDRNCFDEVIEFLEQKESQLNINIKRFTGND